MMHRRIFLAGLGAASLLPGTALAINETESRELIDTLVADINKVIESGKSENAMLRDFERIFKNYSDTSYIAAYAMGPDARRASTSQKRSFSKAFQSYIARKYGRRFREFIGGRLEVQGVKRVKKWYEVETKAYLKGQSPFDVTFLVSDRSGKNLFFNMYIEGVNLLLTERTEVGAILDQNGGDIDKMIKELSRAG